MNHLPPHAVQRHRRPLAAAGALTVAAALLACNAGLSLAGVADESWSPAEEITAEEIRQDITWLSHDDRQGRGILTDGLDEAADYIAKRFETLGLQKLEGLEGYFQPFELPFGSELQNDKTSLSAEGVKELKLGQHYTPLAWSAPGEFEGELAFAGYGITSERNDYDDFAGLDVEGKVVLVMNFEPHTPDGKSAFTKNERPSRDGRMSAKAAAAQKAGAAALLIVNPPLHHEDDQELSSFGRGSRRSEIPVFHVDRSTANLLLRAAGLPNLRKLQEEIDESGKPAPKEAGKAVVVKGGFGAAERKVNVKNVVGLLPGKKADEFIVVGAHYDHVGMGDYGTSYGRALHNGADDNASGTTAMLALAEAWAKNPQKPERSIIFMAFTAEEIGLVGSKYFTDNPPIALEQVAAMVNLDMVGRIRDQTLFVGGFNAAPAFPEILKEADEASPIELKDMGDEFSSRSDHFNFVQHQIPAVFFFSGLHEQYHSPDDDAPLINVEGMEHAAELIYQVMKDIDSTPRERLAFNKPQGREMLPGGQGQDGEGGNGAQPAAQQQPAQGAEMGERRVRFGIMPDFGAGEGVVAGQVMDDTPAARAGIQAGDVILKIGEREVKSLEDLQAILVNMEPGTKLKVLLKRGGQQQEVEVLFEAAGQRP